MSNRPHDVSVDAEDDDVVTPRSPVPAEDVEHHETPIGASAQHIAPEQEEPDSHNDLVSPDGHHPDSPHNLEEDHNGHNEEEDQFGGSHKDQPVQRQGEIDSDNNEEEETNRHVSESEDELKGHMEEKRLIDHRSNIKKKDSLNEQQSEEADDGNGGSEEDEPTSQHAATEGLYDPAEFQHLPVGSDVRDLFQFITSYTAQVVETDNVLKPFILEYIPAVGDIDAFIKVPRPDDVDDNLGLVVLDEPAAKQSDPTVLDLHMRALSKGGVPKTTVVKKLNRADKNQKEIENWMKNISELHKSKPATNVHYSKPMPDIDALMQEWPAEFEDTLRQVELPTADMDLPLEQYVDLVCSLLDIPVHKSRVQSLHVLFSLYSEFKNSQHFKNIADVGQLESEEPNPRPLNNADTLVL